MPVSRPKYRGTPEPGGQHPGTMPQDRRRLNGPGAHRCRAGSAGPRGAGRSLRDSGPPVSAAGRHRGTADGDPAAGGRGRV